MDLIIKIKFILCLFKNVQPSGTEVSILVRTEVRTVNVIKGTS